MISYTYQPEVFFTEDSPIAVNIELAILLDLSFMSITKAIKTCWFWLIVRLKNN
jgi:hypothetical protein